MRGSEGPVLLLAGRGSRGVSGVRRSVNPILSTCTHMSYCQVAQICRVLAGLGFAGHGSRAVSGLRLIVLVTVPCVRRSCEHFQDGSTRGASAQRAVLAHHPENARKSG